MDSQSEYQIERVIEKLQKLGKLKKRYKKLYKEFHNNYRTNPDRDRLFGILDEMDRIELALMTEEKLANKVACWLTQQIEANNLSDEQISQLLNVCSLK